MQRFILLAFILVLIFTDHTFSQTGQNQFNPENLTVSWELVDNYYQKQPQYLSNLVLTNTGDDPIPAKGWSIYLNNLSDRSKSDQFEIRHINGDLFRLIPGANFEELQPGQSVEISVISRGSALNITGAPAGLYWVWDSKPEYGIAIRNYNVKPIDGPEVLNRGPNDEVPVATPEVVYNSNQKIHDVPASKLPKVFPTPVEYRESDGEFVLSPDIPIKYVPPFESEARYLSNELQKIFGDKLKISAGTVAGKKIILQKGDTEPEGYELNISPEVIVISASEPAGIFYGIQTLKTAIPPSSWSVKQASVTVPALEIEDAPRFEYRAFMQDVARNFRTKEQILKTLDLMSLYKLNTFHFHFNDDEAWRIEIPGLPELTEVGSNRGHTLNNHNMLQPSHGSGPKSEYPGSGYYSTRDFIDILKYATERHIRVIPEIETPGHARAAIKSMDARYRRLTARGDEEAGREFLLRDLEDTSTYRSVQGWDDNVINVALPSTYNFLGKVIDELAAMYEKADAPLGLIHMGGDEVPTGSWTESPAVQSLIENESTVSSVDDLWLYFYQQVDELLKQRGFTLYGWEEIGMTEALWGGDSGTHSVANETFAKRNVQLDVWNNVIGSGAEDLAYRLANAGYKVVLSGVSNFYFDLAYQKSFPEPGLYWGGFLDLDKPFSFIPYNYYKNSQKDLLGRQLDDAHFDEMERLTEEGRKNIVGIQGLLWAEKLIDSDRQEYMLLPKLLGLAERAWAPQPEWAKGDWSSDSEELYTQAWSLFLNRVAKQELPRLDFYADGFNYRIPTAGAIKKDGNVIANVQLPGFVIRYTTDGSEPTGNSTKYTGAISEKGTIKLRVFNSSGRGGRSIEISNL